MFRTLALLCLVAASALAGPWEGGLSDNIILAPIRSLGGSFKINNFQCDSTSQSSGLVGTTAFIELPLSVASAAEKGWVQKRRDNLPEDYEKLSIFCPNDDYTVCVFFDDAGYIAGLQVAISQETYSDSIFDWSVQGFFNWTTDMDGKILSFWTTQQYYITPETLATDPAIRVDQRNPQLMLQDHSILVSGFNGELYRISTNVSDITGPNSDFTEQACIPWMGKHYYYKTNEEMECKADTLFPWFPLVYSNQLIGLGLVTLGKHTVLKGAQNWFEDPNQIAVKAIVPRGPQCLYNLASSPGIVTMHTYFIKHPYLITCIF